MEQYIPWIISAGSLLVAFLSYNRSVSKDDQGEMSAIHEGLLKANIKLDQVCVTTQEARHEIRGISQTVQEHDKRLALLERDVKTAFHKIDRIESDDGK